MNKLFVLFAVTFLAIGLAAAAPEGGTVASIANTTATPDAATAATASGGQISLISISGRSQTQVWAGFVGDVTGTLTLRNSVGDSLYNWTMTTAQGEVFATRNSGTPTWASVACADTGEATAENTLFNMGTRWDNFTQTMDVALNAYSNPAFDVGGVPIGGGACGYGLNTLVNSGTSTTFGETVLSDGTANLIYVAHLANDQTGYNGTTYDFQMLVPEDAQGSAAATYTNYYFFVELQ